MIDPRDHFCLCGRWGHYGLDTTKGRIWRCGQIDGKPACTAADKEKGQK
jgi:hypothetical protein